MVPCFRASQMSRLRIKTLTSSPYKQVRNKVVFLECKCDFTWQRSRKESSFGVKRKRAGEPCCGAIRALGNNQTTHSPSVLLQWNKEETVALLETLTIMCFVFFAYLIPATSKCGAALVCRLKMVCLRSVDGPPSPPHWFVVRLGLNFLSSPLRPQSAASSHEFVLSAAWRRCYSG